MDGWNKKDAFIGFKIEQAMKDQLVAAAKRKCFSSLSKFVCFLCIQYLKSETLSAGGAKSETLSAVGAKSETLSAGGANV